MEGPTTTTRRPPATHHPPHRFWDTQPINRPRREGDVDGEEEKGAATTMMMRTTESLRETTGPRPDRPLPLPAGFEWCELDLAASGPEAAAAGKEVEDFLAENYGEDVSERFRFAYDARTIRWALRGGSERGWALGVRAGKKRGLVATIGATPLTLRIVGGEQPGEEEGKAEEVRVAAINFLCVRRELRARRLAPVLIKEITRRVTLTASETGISAAVYTTGGDDPLPGAVASVGFYHRPLNVRRLAATGFTPVPPRVTSSAWARMHALPEEPPAADLRPLAAADVPAAAALLRRTAAAPGVRLAEVFPGDDDLARAFLSEDSPVRAFVSEGVEDLVSFYGVDLAVLGDGGERGGRVRVAYAYYLAPGRHSAEALLRSALVLAKREGFDVFNATETAGCGAPTEDLLRRLRFGPGTGRFHYHLFNWRCDPPLPGPETVMLTLV